MESDAPKGPTQPELEADRFIDLPPEKRLIAEKLLAISKRAATHWKEPYKSMSLKELFDELYDERGLPK